MFDQPTIYVSHPIRPNKYSRKENLRLAISCAEKLRALFPEVHFYIPAEGEPVFQAVKEAKLLDEESLIDEIDLRILAKCDGQIVLYWSSSNGCIKERKFAVNKNIPSITIPWFINKASYTQVRQTLTPFINNIINNFRRKNNEQ